MRVLSVTWAWMLQPVHIASRLIPHRERVLITSVVFFIVGPFVAGAELRGVPHLVMDAVGYMIHSFGCAPLVERYLSKLGGRK